MRRSVIRHSLLLGAAIVAITGVAPAYAQNQMQPVVTAAPGVVPAPAGQTFYALKPANIRAGAGGAYTVIGKLAAGQPVQILGASPADPHWLQLATGGFVSATVMSPTPVVVEVQPPPHHHHHEEYAPPSGVNYPVGACEPYSRVVNIAGQPPQQINGTACKQPDGTWKIVNYGVPQPIAPAPVVVQPPVYAQPVPPQPYWR